MSVIQEGESISDRTKVRTRKQPIVGHQTTAIKAQNCFYFNSKSQLPKRKKYQNTTETKNKVGKKIKTMKSPKSTQDIHQTCATLEHSKLKLERVSVASWFLESCMTRDNEDGVSPLQKWWVYTYLKSNSSKQEQRYTR